MRFLSINVLNLDFLILDAKWLKTKDDKIIFSFPFTYSSVFFTLRVVRNSCHFSCLLITIKKNSLIIIAQLEGSIVFLPNNKSMKFFADDFSHHYYLTSLIYLVKYDIIVIINRGMIFKKITVQHSYFLISKKFYKCD